MNKATLTKLIQLFKSRFSQFHTTKDLSIGRFLRSRYREIVWFIGIVALSVSMVLLVPKIEVGALQETWSAIKGSPLPGVVVLAAFALAFIVRAFIWKRVLPSFSFRYALAAIHVSLLGNHVLPLRLGEVLRVTSAVKRGGLPLSSAMASTVMLRGADLLVIVALALILGQSLFADLIGWWRWVLLGFSVLATAGGVLWLAKIVRRQQLRLWFTGGVVAAGALFAWVLEAGIIYQTAVWAGLDLGFREAVLVTALTVGAQVIAVAPGGIGTYEAAAAGTLVALGYGPGESIAVAITAHAFKTAYALGAGSIALFLPSPSAFGRLRLSRVRSEVFQRTISPDGEILLFFPAYNEEATVSQVVKRTPAMVQGRSVRTLVIDDGSTDRTAERAVAAGAQVISFDRNYGLGAAVRRGLSEAANSDIAAVAFCDADEEYSPEELERLVGPILDGKADYVSGSRFKGDIEFMHKHRRFGNYVLTMFLSWVARTPITDGQSGYRAFSAEAAQRADIIHDFNYAQVLTLDLLDKGYRYLEVPISYRFRKEGDSFVSLGSYLRHVVPAVYRELNAKSRLDILTTS